MFRRKSRTQSASATMENSRAQATFRLTTRHKSLPPKSSGGPRVKGILKHRTNDDSLHNPYGETKEHETDSSSGSSPQGRRCIAFKDIQIREYARTLGDNPSCSSGPPIGIAWEYDPDSTVITLEEYEELRPPRRTHFEMILPRDVRQRMLRQEWDVTQMQIAAAVRANIKVKNQRRATVNNLDKATKMEEMMENAGRRVMRGLLMKKSTRKQLEELEHQMDAAHKARAQHQLERMEVAAEDLATDAMEEYDEEESSP